MWCLFVAIIFLLIHRFDSLGLDNVNENHAPSPSTRNLASPLVQVPPLSQPMVFTPSMVPPQPSPKPSGKPTYKPSNKPTYKPSEPTVAPSEEFEETETERPTSKPSSIEVLTEKSDYKFWTAGMITIVTAIIILGSFGIATVFLCLYNLWLKRKIATNPYGVMAIGSINEKVPLMERIKRKAVPI